MLESVLAYCVPGRHLVKRNSDLTDTRWWQETAGEPQDLNQKGKTLGGK